MTLTFDTHLTSLTHSRSRSTQGNNFNNLGSTHNATYQILRISVYWFWKRRFFKVFTIYGHDGHVGHVIQTV